MLLNLNLDTVLVTLDSPNVTAADKCKLSQNSVKCKYVNSKLRFPASLSNVLTDPDVSPSQRQTGVLHHFRLGNFHQEIFTIMSQILTIFT